MKEYKVRLLDCFEQFRGTFIQVTPEFTYSMFGNASDDGIVFYYEGYGYMNAVKAFEFEQIDLGDGTKKMSELKDPYYIIRYDWSKKCIDAFAGHMISQDK